MIPPSALTSLCCLPCGCFVDLDKLFAYEPEATEKRTGRRFLLCPFCEATFLAVDFQRWAKASIQEISEALYTCVCRPPCTMIKFGQSLLEVRFLGALRRNRDANTNAVDIRDAADR